MASSSIDSTQLILKDAAVIGCSGRCDDDYCDKQVHPDNRTFYHFDTNTNIHPDSSINLGLNDLPPDFNKQFKLTILEHLPYYAYNQSGNERFREYFGDGAKAFSSMMQMTTDDGFIMIMGNPREYQFRKSIAELNYVEIAQRADFPQCKVVLIPKNQSIPFCQIKEKINALPKALQQSITTACMSSSYQPTKPTSYCRLNYTPNDKNQLFIDTLENYRLVRDFDNRQYKKSFCLFGKQFNFGFSKDQKHDAVVALTNVLLGNEAPETLQPHRAVLQNGQLGQIVSSFLRGRELSYYTENTHPLSPAIVR
jgi:hypothetical protein